MPNVRIDIRTGVVAQKKTQRASRYLRPFKYFSSSERCSKNKNKQLFEYTNMKKGVKTKDDKNVSRSVIVSLALM